MTMRSFVASCVLVAGSAQHAAASPPNPVVDWASIVQPAIHSASAPRSAGTSQILHTMAMLAVYDAVVAIEGGSEPYGAGVTAEPWADTAAAVATAAYATTRARIVPAQYAYLDARYSAYLAAIPDSPAKSEGVRVGQAAADLILALRANDGFGAVVPYGCSSTPPAIGEFEPDTGCPAASTDPQPADVKVAGIQPFTSAAPIAFRPDGPRALTSRAYAEDFVETRDYGRIDSTVRTADQTDLAYFWAEHPYAYWNRNLIALAVSRELDVAEAARFFAMVHTSVSDAVIAGFAAKYFFTAWRPRTAIPLADFDGNPDTVADPTWKPLLSVNHPEFPSGHGFWSTALVNAVGAFFGTNTVRWTLVTSKVAVPNLVQDRRTYSRLNAILRDMDDARVFAGLHWRHSMRAGGLIGRKVAQHVTTHYFSVK